MKPNTCLNLPAQHTQKIVEVRTSFLSNRLKIKTCSCNSFHTTVSLYIGSLLTKIELFAVTDRRKDVIQLGCPKQCHLRPMLLFRSFLCDVLCDLLLHTNEVTSILNTKQSNAMPT